MADKHRNKTLIIPDSHATPDLDNLRFRALGNFIVEERPNFIINMGDFADMPSLSSYDVGKASFEGRRYKDDIASVVDAQEELFKPVKVYRQKTRRPYNPRLVYCGGNHDWGRILTAVNLDPKLEGIISPKDMQLEKYGWEVHPFQEPVQIDGISYCHYFASGISGRPISGESIGRTLCTKLHGSAVVGHSHVFDHSERTKVDGTKIFGLSSGCFAHPKMIAAWNIGTYRLWWRGVTLLVDCDGKGYYDEIRAVTQRKIMREYL
jgi:hypothetical protein